MKNVIELSSVELEAVSGGATFAYRVGRCIRWLGYSQMPCGVGYSFIAIEMKYGE